MDIIVSGRGFESLITYTYDNFVQLVATEVKPGFFLVRRIN